MAAKAVPREGDDGEVAEVAVRWRRGGGEVAVRWRRGGGEVAVRWRARWLMRRCREEGTVLWVAVRWR